MTTAKKNAYTGPVIFRVCDKKSGVCLGYLVPGSEGKTYEVTYNHEDHHYVCTCPDHKVRGRQCKHIDAVLEVVAIRKERETAANDKTYAVALEEAMTAYDDLAATKKPKHEAPLLGSSQGFSMMAPERPSKRNAA